MSWAGSTELPAAGASRSMLQAPDGRDWGVYVVPDALDFEELLQRSKSGNWQIRTMSACNVTLEVRSTGDFEVQLIGPDG